MLREGGYSLLKYRITYAVILLGLAAFYIYCNSYISLYVIYLVLALTLISGVMAFFTSRSISAGISGSSSRADPEKRLVEICAVVSNVSFLPVPIIIFDTEIKDASEIGAVRRQIKTSLGSYDERSIYISLGAPYAALVEANIRRLSVCDCFGIFSFRVRKKCAGASVLITPSSKSKRQSFDRSTSSVSDSDVYSDTQKGDDRSQVFELREYREGDDLRNVHWGLSSKHDSLIVKEFSKPLEESCIVLLESSLGSGRELKKERADRVLSEFTALSESLLGDGQPFLVCWYSSAGTLAAYEIKKLEDMAAVLRSYLSCELPNEAMMTYKTYFSNGREPSGVYYIYDSRAAQASERIADGVAVIDVGKD